MSCQSICWRLVGYCLVFCVLVSMSAHQDSSVRSPVVWFWLPSGRADGIVCDAVTSSSTGCRQMITSAHFNISGRWVT